MLEGDEGWGGGLILNAVLSAIFAGIVATLATIAIEKLGGVLGGILGSTPTTIIPASIGLAIQATSYDGVAQALFSVPIGMLGSSLFLYVWRIVPPYLPQHLHLYIRLFIMVIVSIAFWCSIATILYLFILFLSDYNVPTMYIGIFTLLSNLVGGVIVCFQPLPAPKGKKAVTPCIYVARALFAAAAIGVAVFISAWNEVVGGIFSTFPAIFLTSMVSLWLSQGEAVPAGATGPMMLGCSAVGTYACTYAFVYPAIDSAQDEQIVALGVSAFVSWLTAVLGISIPSYFFVTWRQSKVNGSGETDGPTETTPLVSLPTKRQ